MTKKRPSSCDQKALLIHDATLTTADQRENELIKEISFTAHLCQEMIRFIQRGDPGRDHLIASLESYLSDASRSMRQLRKLQKGGD